MIRFTCKCGAVLEVSRNLAEKECLCPECEQVVRVPAQVEDKLRNRIEQRKTTQYRTPPPQPHYQNQTYAETDEDESNKSTSGLAIAGFVLAILQLPIISTLVCIAAIIKCLVKKEKGIFWAVLGFFISIF